ncbi:TPA: hypothetical protein ACIACF_004585, partial [Escherichia coli]
KNMCDFKISNIKNNNVNIPTTTNIGVNCEISFPDGFSGRESVNNTIKMGEHTRFRYFRIIVRGSNNNIVIDDGTFYTGTIMVEGSHLNINIGKNCTINGLFITCRDKDVIIGNDCLISSEVKIRSSDSHKIFDLNDDENQINKPHSPVIIGNHVWIGQDVYIGKNSFIADGCIITARATITKKIHTKNCIVAEFNKIIKENIVWKK